MSGDDDTERLRRLEERIAAAKGKPHSDEVDGAHYDQAGLAWRMVTELVAGLGIGLAIGLGLDTLLGTAPILMVVFTGLGFAAGIKVMLNTAGEMTAGAQGATEREGDGLQDAPAEDETRKG
jgi:ATP synthase protein I